MERRKRKPYVIGRLDQIRALVAPSRQEIVDALEIMGPASIAAVADLLGRPPDSLYHHVRILVSVGLVQKVETRMRGRNREAIYDLPGRPLSLAYDLGNRSKRSALKDLVRGMSRMAGRDFERAADRGAAEVDGPRRNLRGGRMVGRLDGAQLEAINRLYQRIVEITCEPPRAAKEAEFHAITFFIAPLDRKR